MSLIDDCNELPSMENWLNAGADWNEHHDGIIEPTTTRSAPAPLLFYGHAETAPTPSDISLFKIKEAVTHPFLKLDALEICKENPDALLGRIESPKTPAELPEEKISEQARMSAMMAPLASSLLDRTSSLDDASLLYLEGDSPRGPLSPAAHQLGTSRRPVSIKPGLPLEDTSEATTSWIPAPKHHQQNVDLGYAAYEAMATAATPLSVPAVAAPPTFLAVPAAAAAGDAMVAPPAILFPAPLTLSSVPSMDEIARSRPKRRNVRISKDPTSVAARHRRERISDRVRVLQHFVPGGTKMDTASMLDEAIHYVKFLQQQLQMLERFGNSYDPRFMTQEDPVMMMPQGGSFVQPFDLNSACYQTFPSTSMVQDTSSSLQQPLPTWPTSKTTSPFCSSQGFPDSAQEQFCH